MFLGWCLNYLHIQTIWPFSPRKLDDMEVSKRLVRALLIPEQTKQFVFAMFEPESRAIIYVLAVQAFSEQSAEDAECLIKEVRPGAVVAQITPSAMSSITTEGQIDDLVKSLPTTSIGVMKGCLVDKMNEEMYEKAASYLVSREIFGTSLHGHLLATKRAASEAGSHLLFFETPFLITNEIETEEGILHQPNSFAHSGSRISLLRFCLTKDIQFDMVKSLVSSLANATSESDPVSEMELGNCLPRCNYQAPVFAQSLYPYLLDLYGSFVDLSSINKALASAQKMLLNVSKGEPVEARTLTEVHFFRTLVEGLRLALNNAARCPNRTMQRPSSCRLEFTELPMDEMSQVLLAQVLQSEAKKFKSIVAIVEAQNLAGLRKHWNTHVPWDVKSYAEKILRRYGHESCTSKSMDRKKLTDKSVLAVGAGTTAVLGVASVPKIVSVSSFLKLLSLKFPITVELAWAYTQKAAALTFAKVFTSSNVVTFGAQTTAVLKATACGEKVRAVVHCVICSAQRNSISATQTAFYEIMRKRRVQRVGSMPYVRLGSSMATFTGLCVYGEGIKCAAEALPAVPSIACLGRGIQRLHQASQEVKTRNGSKNPKIRCP